ncbi:PQQ-dependent sugar dehydrogenase [Paucisalibacillus globulus]|uniref:PQQ-dependent sugar dehydrogenase n=1 Tax=Paucisalibacillus globulus TaxID=351095 RepID=UPI000BB6F373|nr:PQQ-dependent sugar dehydrogenase [Paucisalibacillus globulus]
MSEVRVRLRPLVSKLNLPTVIKTAVLPGEQVERLFIATQVGEVFYVGDSEVVFFLDIRDRIITLGTDGGYDERGLLGLAFHPQFYDNGLFYLHYSVAGTQGPGALQGEFQPDPCDPSTLNLRWENRETQYDHIDTVEEWFLPSSGVPSKRRTLLNLRRPFANHNGVNSLNFSPETGRLVLTTGDGGSGFDPFNLSQDEMEIAGKIIEIDINRNTNFNHPPIATRFNELPVSLQETLTVLAKGVRNIPGISYQQVQNQFIKYVGNVGQDLVESVYSFIQYNPIPVSRLVQSNAISPRESLVNFGWRGWEGAFPTPIIRDCATNPNLDEKILAYYEEAVALSGNRLQPLTSYFHQDARPDKFAGTALTGVQAYMGNEIPTLTGSVVFTDGAKKVPQSPVRGALAYTTVGSDGQHHDFHEIQVNHDFGSGSAYFVSLGSNWNQSRLYLGVYGSIKVTDRNQGTVFEIIP